MVASLLETTCLAMYGFRNEFLIEPLFKRGAVSRMKGTWSKNEFLTEPRFKRDTISRMKGIWSKN